MLGNLIKGDNNTHKDVQVLIFLCYHFLFLHINNNNNNNNNNSNSNNDKKISEEAGTTPSRNKNKTCQRADKLIESTVEDIRIGVSKMANWKAAGPDLVQGY